MEKLLKDGGDSIGNGGDVVNLGIISSLSVANVTTVTLITSWS